MNRFSVYCAALGMLAMAGVAQTALAAPPRLGWYGHDVVPFAPDASGYVVVVPTQPWPYHQPRNRQLERPYDDGVHDNHGGWSARYLSAERYPWGWFGARRGRAEVRSGSYYGDRTDWSVRRGN